MRRFMVGRRAIPKSLAAVFVCAVTSSCFGFSPTYGGANPDTQAIYVPYIETVNAPTTIQAGDRITISARLTTALDKSLLTYAKYSVTGNYFTEPQPQLGLQNPGEVLLPMLTSNYGGDNQVDALGNAVVFDGSTSTPGRLYFYIASTQAPSQGGTQLTVLRDSGGVRFESVDLSQFRFVEVIIDVI